MKKLLPYLFAVILLLGGGLLALGLEHDTKVAFGATPFVIPEPGGTLLVNGVVAPNPTTWDYTIARIYNAATLYGFYDGTTVPVHIQAVRQTLTAATTTPCNLQNPFNATSTIQSASINITTGTSSSQQLQFAIATTPNALTNPISTATVGSGALATLLVGETASSTGLGNIVAPNGYVNVGSPASTALTYGGNCSALFETVN